MRVASRLRLRAEWSGVRLAGRCVSFRDPGARPPPCQASSPDMFDWDRSRILDGSESHVLQESPLTVYRALKRDCIVLVDSYHR